MDGRDFRQQTRYEGVGAELTVWAGVLFGAVCYISVSRPPGVSPYIYVVF